MSSFISVSLRVKDPVTVTEIFTEEFGYWFVMCEAVADYSTCTERKENVWKEWLQGQHVR